MLNNEISFNMIRGQEVRFPPPLASGLERVFSLMRRIHAHISACMPENEIDQVLALEPADPHVVSLPFDDLERHHPAELIVTGLDRC